ncbi:WYL domain-containing protein [Pontibacter sp. Tf4]|uniref:helix-turn-helix transcriptional regulator n=1 Tax=Pontibacter sp. Tf4 TaxID=2761620 RepID=UPI0016243DBC|nr:WYL domain-containing protein [Pontibacter sp. Tf4]MBB6609989.1 WYL domain-containing protein [Pontibacter sp. Tf4]
MPQNKHALVRMRVIDECLRSKTKKYWSKAELIQRISETKDIDISERSLDYDLYQMRHCSQLNYNAPIAYSKKENGYYYTDPNYSIGNFPLNEVELQALAAAVDTLSQYKHIAVFNEFAATVDKVINLVQQISFERPAKGLKFIDFERAPYAKGKEFLDPLIAATRNKSPILLSYLKFDDTLPKERTVSPYLLKEYRNRWYLVGLQHETNNLRKFALDRIHSLRPAEGEVYIHSEGFEPELYFKNTIGISLEDGKVEQIVLSFTPHDGHYVKTQHLHQSQETLIDDDHELRIKLRVVINYELIATILSFGKNVKVLAPEALRQEMLNIFEECRGMYQS